MNPIQVSVLLVAVGYAMVIVSIVLSHNSLYSRWAGAALFVTLASFMGAVASLALAVWRAFA